MTNVFTNDEIQNAKSKHFLFVLFQLQQIFMFRQNQNGGYFQS